MRRSRRFVYGARFVRSRKIFVILSGDLVREAKQVGVEPAKRAGARAPGSPHGGTRFVRSRGVVS